MRPPKINLLEPDRHLFPRKRRFSVWKGVVIGLIAAVIIIPAALSLISLKVIEAADKLNPTDGKREKISLVEQVKRLMGNSERRLRGEDRDRINILVMGEGGEGHDGADLTDTMLFVSIEPKTDKVGILSLPRDLWVFLPGYGYSKINAANALAEADKKGTGGQYSAEVVSQLLDQPVDYYVRVDFSAFKTLVDDVGGVTVNVEHEFTDYAYPTDNELYQTVRFDRGWQTMNGEKALEFVRSRHGNNGEGSDFARSRRQQLVLSALKDKLVSFDTLLNPSRAASVLETLQTHVITDMELWEIIKLAKIAKNVRPAEIVRQVLDDNPAGPLYATTMQVSNGDAYVLMPRRGDWTDVREIAKDVMTYKPAAAQAETAQSAKIKVEVMNGTTRVGLAQKTRDLLAKVGYDVVKIGNADAKDVEKTVIYDKTNGGHPRELATLQNILNADISLTAPGFLSSGITPSQIGLPGSAPGTSEDADFVIVIGRNYLN